MLIYNRYNQKHLKEKNFKSYMTKFKNYMDSIGKNSLKCAVKGFSFSLFLEG